MSPSWVYQTLSEVPPPQCTQKISTQTLSDLDIVWLGYCLSYPPPTHRKYQLEHCPLGYCPLEHCPSYPPHTQTHTHTHTQKISARTLFTGTFSEFTPGPLQKISARTLSDSDITRLGHVLSCRCTLPAADSLLESLDLVFAVKSFHSISRPKIGEDFALLSAFQPREPKLTFRVFFQAEVFHHESCLFLRPSVSCVHRSDWCVSAIA